MSERIILYLYLSSLDFFDIQIQWVEKNQTKKPCGDCWRNMNNFHTSELIDRWFHILRPTLMSLIKCHACISNVTHSLYKLVGSLSWFSNLIDRLEMNATWLYYFNEHKKLRTDVDRLLLTQMSFNMSTVLNLVWFKGLLLHHTQRFIFYLLKFPISLISQ